jgi:surfactin family lipopeptide synthetase B
LLTIYFILISKISGREDIAAGTVTAGRNRPDIEPVVGMFVNTLPIRTSPTGDKTFRTLLKEVKQQTLLAFENQFYPFENLVKKLAVKRDSNYNPLFNVVFVFNNIHQPGPDMGEEDLKIKLHRYEEPTAKFHLVLQALQQDSLKMTWIYRSKLFKPQTIKRFSGYFKELVSGILSHKDIHIKDLFISHSLLKAKTRTPQKDFNF